MRKTMGVVPFVSLCCGLAGQTPAMKAQFEVASIRPSKRGVGDEGRGTDITAPPGSLTMRYISLKLALTWAFDVKPYQISGPGWLDDEHYDILAKAAAGEGVPQLRRMLQSLLTDRFKMTLHRETKDAPALVLVVGKDRPRLSAGNPTGQSKVEADGPKLKLTDTSMPEFANLLSAPLFKLLKLETPVIDETGLAGRYSFSFDGAPFLDALRSGGFDEHTPDAEVVAGVLRDVLKAQLGLEVERRKRAMDLIVVDSSEKVPTEN